MPRHSLAAAAACSTLPVKVPLMSVRRLSILACLSLLLAAAPAQAFRLVPIEMDFTPSGRGATQIFRVENDTAEPVAIEIRMAGRRMSDHGDDVLDDAGDRFVVFPEQIVLQPAQSQSVRVQWIGDANPAQELAFRLIAEQLPIDLGKTPGSGGRVRLLVRYLASVYVTPPGAKPDLAVTAAEPRATPQGRRLDVTVSNRGSRRQLLRDPTLTLTAGGHAVTLRGAQQLAGLAGENVLAGAIRHFLIPLPGDLTTAPATGTITVAP